MTQPRPLAACLVATGIHVLVGTVGLFVVFLFVYGFADEITPTMHVAFLVGTLVVAVVSGAIAFGAESALAGGRRAGLRIAAWTTVAAYGAALGLGTVVSLANEDQNSVTADQPDLPFVVLVVLCAVAVVGALVALRRQVSRGA